VPIRVYRKCKRGGASTPWQAVARSGSRVNRAPVLTLWAAVVAERLGHPVETALSLASHVAGTGVDTTARQSAAKQ
jgi:hypothetical protein